MEFVCKIYKAQRRTLILKSEKVHHQVHLQQRMNTCEQAPSELLGAGLPVLLGLVQGPDHVPGVELGVARDDVAAAHHAVTHLLQAVQNLRKAANVIDDRCLRQCSYLEWIAP